MSVVDVAVAVFVVVVVAVVVEVVVLSSMRETQGKIKWVLKMTPYHPPPPG